MKHLFVIIFSILPFVIFAQKKNKTKTLVSVKTDINISLIAENWEFQNGKVQFETYDSRPVMKISANAGTVVLKNTSFSNGTIEYDFIPVDPMFASLYFHWQDKLENECFYFRTGTYEDSTAMDVVQYAPHISGVNLWDLLGQYQGNAYLKKTTWNHVKVVISGMQMRAYLNDMQRPVLEIPRLEGNTSKGLIGFDGESVISNLVIKMDETENLPAVPGVDLTAHDPRYLRNWQVSKPFETPEKVDFSYDFIPKPDQTWETITAERMGLVNLTRKFGGSEKRRMVWLKLNVDSKSAQNKKINLGFSDEVWVMLNGRFLYTDKNAYGRPMMKAPFGRCSIENASFSIPFKAGKNEILMAVANDFFGWAIVARLEDMKGITIENK
ncbi:hypothetical protein [Dyadobacter frigoris]|uniref:DUF1080 domain-containing protein n=1 Tax=Dyadobacter frigoris TaxID=2576211 RepID=A0A4U6D605_9BACT|nr:hypothetical protein [Dyadobacter frigoris]TKT92810.1 hypothetical protein FDK13_08405 [Dyadobacter frigoris]GLU54429.1 hypothetical protein Dfri01_38900 [Dyadobacter frigoris]